jgi:hypothetical protein
MRRASTLLLLTIGLQSSAMCARSETAHHWSSGKQLLALELDAPFSELLKKAGADPDYAVTGRLTYRETGSSPPVQIPGVQVSTRGHTSKEPGECDFPKLRLRFTGAAADGSLFAGTRALKVGTHCADRPDQPLTPKFGRLANQKSPHREALVYALLDAAEVPTLRSRPVRISYTFTDLTAPGQPPLVRNALLLEDDGDAMERLGTTDELTEDRFDTALSTFDTDAVARLTFAQAMIGNFDWCLRFYPGDRYRCDDRHPLWNVLGLAHRAGWALPLIYDFDLSGIVVEQHVWFGEVFAERFAPGRSRIEIEAIAQLQRTRSLFDRVTLDRTRRWFLRHQDAVYRAISESAADDRGRALATAHLDAFFDAIRSDRRFYRPVVAVGNVPAHLDSALTQAACGDRSTIPIGTPVGDPLAEHGGLVQVRVLDALWNWTPPQRCDAIHQQPVWIPRAAIDTNYPR